MLDHLLGLVLFGLGLANPTKPAVKGDSTAVVLSESDTSGASGASSISGSGGSDDDEADATGTSGESSEEKSETYTGATGTIRPIKPTESEHQFTRSEVLSNIREREKKLQEVFDAREMRQTKELSESQERATLNTQTARKAFTAKLAKLKDSKKKTIAASLDLKIAEVNKKRTTIMLSFVSKLQKILDKISIRAAEAKKAGKDITSVDSAVTAAQATVASALTAVMTQAGKTYVAQVTSDETLKNDMETAMKSLKTDLEAVSALIDTAKKAVYVAHAELSKVMEESVATPTVAATP